MPRGSEKGGVTSGRLRNQISQSLNRRNPLGEGGRVHKLEMQPAQPSYIQKKDQKLVDPLGLQATYLPVTVKEKASCKRRCLHNIYPIKKKEVVPLV